jgi:predicted transcriptional regulator
MYSLTVELPEDVARGLTETAAAEHKTAQDVAVEALRSLLLAPGSPAAILRMMRSGPHPSEADVQALEAAIASGRLPVAEPETFTDRSNP